MAKPVANSVKYNDSFLSTIYSGSGKRSHEKYTIAPLELLDLPKEMIHTILLNLPFQIIHNYSMTCKNAYQIRNDTTLWQLLHQRDFSSYPVIENATMKAYHNLYRYFSNLARGMCASYRIDNDESLKLPHGASKFAVFEGKLFASYGWGEIKVWDIKTLDCLKTLEGNPGGSRFIVIAQDKLIVAYGGSIKVWNMETWDCVKTFAGHVDHSITALAYHDGLLISASFGGEIKIWSLETWDCLHTFRGNPTGECSLAIVDGKLFSGFSLGPRHSQYQHSSVQIRDLKTGKSLNSLMNNAGGISSIFVQDKEKLFIGSASGVIKVWELKDMTYLYSLESHKKAVTSLLIVEGNLISGDTDGEIKIWDLGTRECEYILQVSLNGVAFLAFDDGRLIISTCGKSEIAVLDFKATDEQIISELVDLFMSEEKKDVTDAGDRYARLPDAMKEKTEDRVVSKLVDLFVSGQEKDVLDAGARFEMLPEAMQEKSMSSLLLNKIEDAKLFF